MQVLLLLLLSHVLMSVSDCKCYHSGFLKHGGRVIAASRENARDDMGFGKEIFVLSQYRNIVDVVFKKQCKLSRLRKYADSKGFKKCSEQKEVTCSKVPAKRVKSLVLVSLSTSEGIQFIVTLFSNSNAYNINERRKSKILEAVRNWISEDS